MMDHVAGNHSAAFELAGDLHVMLSSEGTEAAAWWAAIGGALLEEGPLAAPVHKVSTLSAAEVRHKPQASIDGLIRQIDKGPRWRRGLTGVRYAATGTTGARLMKLEPGQSVPKHGHADLEATVVIQGRFSDGHGTYKRGDLVLGEPGMRHKPQAVGDEACVCLVAQKPGGFWRNFI
ncbi:cupin domain-containing protein [Hyphomonas pacifica]|uniref:cupin domain-containing protein n=1 Tax=Hyphomonas pacifica TaxID=1280941 RepID=UPI000DBF5E5C|nr:cupin domain-containing protein [Hyphomonas pacifica]RAN37090.1 hypothetical protein HY11_09895 [Hyphomonas pacifica]